MKHESLVAIKTFRDSKTGLENRNERKIRTTNSLCRTKKEQKILETLVDDMELSQELQKDILRFAKQDLAVKKSQEKMLEIRDKLSKIVNKNKQILELRKKLQKGSWEKDHSSPQKTNRVFKHSKFKELKIDF